MRKVTDIDARILQVPNLSFRFDCVQDRFSQFRKRRLSTFTTRRSPISDSAVLEVIRYFVWPIIVHFFPLLIFIDLIPLL